MSLSEEIKKIASKDTQSSEEENNQLDMLEKIEKTLKRLGISLEPRFEMPLTSRIRSCQNEK